MSDDSGLLTVHINGKPVTEDDLTYREQRKVRLLMRELLEKDGLDPADWGQVDIVPAIVTVVAQREDPDFTLDDALDMKPGDLAATAGDAEEARPTSAP